MHTIEFKNRPCGTELPMNVGTLSEMPLPLHKGGLHNTDFFEVIIFTKASGLLILDQTKIPLKDQMIIFISPFQKQQWFIDLAQLEAKYLIFQEDFLNEFFSDQLFTYRLQYFYQQQYPFYLMASDPLIQKLDVILGEIMYELRHYRNDSAHLIRSLLYFLLIKLNRDYSLAYQLDTETQINNYAYQFKRLLEKYIREKQRIEDYADLIGISRITLNKASKTQFNLTASQLIKQRLLFEIKNLLIYSEKTIQEIAEELHFSESNHLIRFFKRLSGDTPFKFREIYQNGSI